MMVDIRYGIQDTGYRIHDGYKIHGTRVPVSCTLHRVSCIILLLFASCILHPVSAQLYPVQSTLQITPPYSLTLADYVAPGSEKVALNIFLADVNRPELSVRLRLRIEGVGIRIETKAEYLPEPMMISGGVPLRLIGADLVDYFDPRNLNFSGITQREYEQKAALPEGLYQFTFEVIEYNRGVKISNSATVMAWLILNDPPLINLPKDNDKIRIQSPQQVIFQWTPRHTGSPNSAFSTEYEFRLVEVWPSTRNPNDAILTSPAIFETTTAASTLIYGPAETPLEPGRRYAFRIKAKSIVGVDELNLFKNNGYSQVSTFVYGDACTLPTGIQAEVISSSKIGFAWDTQDNHTGYNIKYRLANTPNAAWYTNTSALNDIEINSLQPATTYEYQVAAACGSYDSEYSPVATVTTNEAQAITYSCGLPLNPFDLDPSQLIESLKTGDVIQAGDFDVKLTEVSGSNGIFTGKGVIEVPFFNKARLQASFSSISVNKELRMVAGSMNITGGGVEVIPAGVMDMMDELTEALALADSALNLVESNLPQPFDPYSFVADKEVKIPGTITSVTKGANGGVVVTASNGTEQTIPAGGTTAITDSNGNGYLIDSKGNIHPTTAAIASAAARREYNLNVNFAKATDTRFGFDAKKHDALLTTYEHVKDNYYASWKSIATGQTDNALALLEGTNVDKTKIHFEQSGQAVTANTQSPSPNTQVLSITGIADGVQESVVALYTPADTTQKEQVLGKLNVVTYNQIDKHVVIVPVNGNTFDKFGSVAILQDSLNKIYNQGIVNWTVELKPGITVEGISPFEDGGTGLLSNFTSHMKKVINAYKENTTPDTYYLFLVSNPQDPSTLGVMPRSKEYGFIFADKHSTLPEVARTIAHELGHGAFNLHHTFMEPNYTITKGTTDNLMDYPAGWKLYKYQWDKIRYPDIVVGIFESDEEGQSVKIPIAKCLNDSNLLSGLGKVFFAPNGDPIQLKSDMIPYGFFADYPSQINIAGRLVAFKKNNQAQIYYLDSKNEYSKYWGPYDGVARAAGELISLDAGSDADAKLVKIDTNGKYNGIQLTDYTCPLLPDAFQKQVSVGATGAGNLVLVDHSDGKDGVSLLTPSERQSVETKVAEINASLKVSGKIYVLNPENPNYQKYLDEAEADTVSGKSVITLSKGTNGKVTSEMHFSFLAPKWLNNTFPSEPSCASKFIKDALDTLHSSPLYIISTIDKQIIAEYAVVIYKGIFSTFYCATSEEAVKNSSNTGKFIAGALHELVASVDVADMVGGIIELAKGTVTLTADSYTSYISDVRILISQFRSGSVIDPKDLTKKLLPPPIRQYVTIINKAVTISDSFVKFYFTDCNEMCSYRYGQFTVMIVPIILTAGEWALVKSGKLISKFRSFKNAGKQLDHGEDVVDLLADGENAGATIVNDGEKILIKESEEATADVITTVEKQNENVLIEGERNLDEVIQEGDLEEVLTPSRTGPNGEIIESPGSKGAWNKKLNKTPLDPGKIYRVDNFEYHTDAQGRIKKVKHNNLTINSRERNIYQQKTKCKKAKNGLADDDGGHIIGSQFGGPSEQINYLPMKRSINQAPGSYYQMETEWRNILESNGTVTDIEWNISYGSDGRPIRINVTADVNGIPKTYSHIN